MSHSLLNCSGQTLTILQFLYVKNVRTVIYNVSVVRCCYGVKVIVQSLEDPHAVVKRTENNNVIKD